MSNLNDLRRDQIAASGAVNKTTSSNRPSLQRTSLASTSQSQPQQRFSSNLCAVLNDPRKDRNKINYLFTKTWGSDFVETATPAPIQSLHLNYKNIKLNEFKEYINNISEKLTKHNRNKIDLEKSSSGDNLKLKQQQLQASDLEKIPKIFFDPNFNLSNRDTFNQIISSKFYDPNSNGKRDAFSSSTNMNPFQTGSNSELEEAESCKLALDKLGVYLDIIEMHISKQISTKANTFFNAIHSQDEVQEDVLRTCSAVKSLRKNIAYLDEHVVLKSIKIIKLFHLKLKYKNLIEKLEYMSSVYHTQPTIQLHLASSEFTGALDLISMSQEILRQDLRGIRSLRHFDSQFTEIEKAIDKMLHEEFTKYIISDLSRDFSQGSNILNQEKLGSLLLGILRIKTVTFIDLCKDEILIYLKSTIKQTVVDYISRVEDDSMSNNEDDNNIRLIDRVRQLKIQEFLHLLSKVLDNIKTMLGRVQSIIKLTVAVLNSAAGVIDDEQNDLDEYNTIFSTKELINKSTYTKLIANINDLTLTASDYAQERLVNLLEGKFKDEGLDRLSSNDFISLSNLIDQFVLDFDLIANKKTSSLRSWLQNQANKFLSKFHSDKKDKLTLALDSELWKQTEISSEIQNLIDHVLKNGLGAPIKKFDVKSKNNSNYLVIENEKYAIFGTVIVLLKLMIEYCQLSNDIPNLSFDIMTRLIEIFKIFNSKTYKMILGVGAVELGLLKLITFKTLAITYRCLELSLHFLYLVKEFFKEKLTEKQAQTEKQFNQLIKDFTDHKNELINKIIYSVDEIFRELLSKYEVIAPVPSQCFRSITQQLVKVHTIVSEIVGSATLVQLFTDIHLRFKQRLGYRLKELNVVNDFGPQNALILSDMNYYKTQFKTLNGLDSITLNFADVWET